MSANRLLGICIAWLVAGMSIGGFILDGHSNIRLTVEAVLAALSALLFFRSGKRAALPLSQRGET